MSVETKLTAAIDRLTAAVRQGAAIAESNGKLTKEMLAEMRQVREDAENREEHWIGAGVRLLAGLADATRPSTSPGPAPGTPPVPGAPRGRLTAPACSSPHSVWPGRSVWPPAQSEAVPEDTCGWSGVACRALSGRARDQVASPGRLTGSKCPTGCGPDTCAGAPHTQPLPGAWRAWHRTHSQGGGVRGTAPNAPGSFPPQRQLRRGRMPTPGASAARAAAPPSPPCRGSPPPLDAAGERSPKCSGIATLAEPSKHASSVGCTPSTLEAHKGRRAARALYASPPCLRV